MFRSPVDVVVIDHVERPTENQNEMRPVHLAIFGVVLGIRLLAQDATSVVISGEVTGGSGKHTIYVGLWDEASYLKTPVRGLRFEAGRPARYTFSVPKGRWAISAYEDRNENGLLDQGISSCRLGRTPLVDVAHKNHDADKRRSQITSGVAADRRWAADAVERPARPLLSWTFDLVAGFTARFTQAC